MRRSKIIFLCWVIFPHSFILQKIAAKFVKYWFILKGTNLVTYWNPYFVFIHDQLTAYMGITAELVGGLLLLCWRHDDSLNQSWRRRRHIHWTQVGVVVVQTVPDNGYHILLGWVGGRRQNGIGWALNKVKGAWEIWL